VAKGKKPKKLSVSLEEIRRATERALEEDQKAHAAAPAVFAPESGECVDEVDPAREDL